jgi:hypothetical protein
MVFYSRPPSLKFLPAPYIHCLQSSMLLVLYRSDLTNETKIVTSSWLVMQSIGWTEPLCYQLCHSITQKYQAQLHYVLGKNFQKHSYLVMQPRKRRQVIHEDDLFTIHHNKCEMFMYSNNGTHCTFRGIQNTLKQEASRPDSSAVQSQLYTDYHSSWFNYLYIYSITIAIKKYINKPKFNDCAHSLQ